MYPIARQQLAAADVSLTRFFTAAQSRACNTRAQLGRQSAVVRGVGDELRAGRVDEAGQRALGCRMSG